MSKSRDTGLFADQKLQRRRVLILPRFLRQAADEQAHHDAGDPYTAAHAILKKWADMESKGQLAEKREISLNANFLNDIFGNALNYPAIDHATHGKYLLERELHVPGVGSADGAIGHFPMDSKSPNPIAVIELKDSGTDLDTDKSNGRTAVQQLFDYLNALPETKWGILSNFSTIRLYNKNYGTQAFEEFTLQKLKSDPLLFEAFWCLLEKSGLVPSSFHPIPRADKLIVQTDTRLKEVGDELYSYYALQRVRLVEHLQSPAYNKSFDQAVHIAQKILNRIIFIAFCEKRGLLPQDIIKRTAKLPPVFRVTNPLWRQFLDLFYLVDNGHPGSEIEHGYNGGLFKHDDQVDNLQLDDSWTSVFTSIAGYDFQHEVNVDVLGHIFERSINEIQRARIAGLFGPTATPADKPKMQKSAERKRTGTYYTPPEFTHFIVQQAVVEPIRERCEKIAQSFLAKNLAPAKDPLSPPVGTHPDLAAPAVRIAFHSACIQAIRNFKILDPACGSGAFLIAAYDALDDLYREQINLLLAAGDASAPALLAAMQDWIVHENLHGVDLSEEAVDITRLALWIRSARPGKTLADLSHNIVWGNSLVDDPALLPPACKWKGWRDAFPAILAGNPPPTPSPGVPSPGPSPEGFDAVIGNPPWERLKLQEREFFDLHAPEIAAAENAATRRKLIAQLEKKKPAVYEKYVAAQQAAENASTAVRASGRFPLTAKGDLNTYMLFAELARTLVAPTGRVGILVPSGIATDNTTREFFADLIDSQSLIKLYDFENKMGIFPDVHRAFKFCTLILGGSAVETPKADFVFFAHRMEDLDIKSRHITLSKRDIALLNPNTKTCPIFRSRRDAELTKAVYGRIPVLVDKNRKQGQNPWQVIYFNMFHQTNDAELFAEPESLASKGFKLSGNHYTKGKQIFLPLYEAKMIQAFDHRAASVETKEGNWVRQGQTMETRPVEHENPEYAVQSRWWVNQEQVDATLDGREAPAYVTFKDVTSSTNQRTMIAAFVPHVALANSAPALLMDAKSIPLPLQACLLANLNSLAYDYIARQKVGGNHLNFFIVEQLPTLTPDTYADKCPWDKKQTLEKWISERVLKLTCTANDMIPLAQACNFNPKGKPPHIWKWKDAEREQLRAELDAAYFILYGITDPADITYILSTFQAAGDPQDPHSTAAQVLTAFDSLH